MTPGLRFRHNDFLRSIEVTYSGGRPACPWLRAGAFGAHLPVATISMIGSAVRQQPHGGMAPCNREASRSQAPIAEYNFSGR